MNIEERIKELAADQLGINVNKVHNTSTYNELGGDSLDAFEFEMNIEDEFNIAVEDDTFNESSTIQDVINYVERSV